MGDFPKRIYLFSPINDFRNSLNDSLCENHRHLSSLQFFWNAILATITPFQLEFFPSFLLIYHNTVPWVICIKELTYLHQLLWSPFQLLVYCSQITVLNSLNDSLCENRRHLSSLRFFWNAILATITPFQLELFPSFLLIYHNTVPWVIFLKESTYFHQLTISGIHWMILFVKTIGIYHHFNSFEMLY